MPTTYPFDSTGKLPSNKITNELHTINSVNGVDHNAIIPDAAPLYADSLVVVRDDGSYLEHGVDYEYIFNWEQAEQAVGSNIIGGLVFLDKNILGTFGLQYQTLGGVHVDSPANTIQSGLIALHQGVNVDWSTAPATFPPTEHTHPLEAQPGMNQIYAMLGHIRDAVSDPGGLIQLEDVSDIDQAFINPLLGRLDQIIAALVISSGLESSVNDLSGKMLSLLPFNNTISTGSENYLVPIAGFFYIAIGKRTFVPSAEPASVNFAGSIGTPLFCTVNVSRTDTSADSPTHVVNHNFAESNRISGIEVDYMSEPDQTERTLSYIAIGIKVPTT